MKRIHFLILVCTLLAASAFGQNGNTTNYNPQPYGSAPYPVPSVFTHNSALGTNTTDVLSPNVGRTYAATVAEGGAGTFNYQCVANSSPDAQVIAFHSDMFDGLGTDNASAKRTDIFVYLDPPVTAGTTSQFSGGTISGATIQ